jgi:hypothetical protein
VFVAGIVSQLPMAVLKEPPRMEDCVPRALLNWPPLTEAS